MIKNYLKIAIRNLLKQKGYSFINITGLALGMAVCIFLFLWIQDEFSFDKFHLKSDILYRLEQDQKSPQGNFHVNVTPFPVGPALKEQIPEISNTARFWGLETMLIRYRDKSFFETGIRSVDPSFLEMFSFPLVKGDKNTALKDPHSIIINESQAEKYFSNENPIGKSLNLNNKYMFTVTGIIKNAPKNSSITYEMLVPFEFVRELGRYRDQWASNSITTFIELPDKNNIKSVNEKITNLIFEHSKSGASDYKPDYMLNSLTRIRLYGYFGFNQQYGAIQGIYILSGIGIFILIIACINFMNLSTARSANRAKEVGLRKVVGAYKRHIIAQFYGESILITIISMIFSLILVLLLLPLFNDLSGKKAGLQSLMNWPFFIGLFSISFITGIISGSYPALFISSFQPIKVLKGKMRNSAKSGFFRKFLVVIQFCLSIILVIGATLIYQQVQFMRNKSLGYEKEQLIYLPLRGETQRSYSLFKDELLKDPRISNVSGIIQPPTNIGSNSWGAEWDGKDPAQKILISQTVVDFDYVETLKIQMLEGRTFSKNYMTDTSRSFMINEEVQKIMGVQSAVGKRFKFNGIDGNIIGVMKNYHFQNVQYNIEPLAITVNPRFVRFAIVRLPVDNLSNSLDYVKSTWQKLFPLFPYDYKFFDDDFAVMFSNDERMGNIFKYATILAIFIACLGLFGLASFMAEQRTKEIGVRKILGSTTSGIVLIFSKEFIKWVITANIIAWPLAYFLINKWLQSYAYKTPINWWIFILAGFLSITIAVLTVSYQSLKAARSNPVNSLRYE